MLEWLGQLISINGNPWYETFPFLTGTTFMVITLVARWWHEERPVFDPAALVFAFGEGMALFMMVICAFSLGLFNKQFAIDYITINNKTFVTAMLFASIAILREFLDRWSGVHSNLGVSQTASHQN
jgi:hypothetical protein